MVLEYSDKATRLKSNNAKYGNGNILLKCMLTRKKVLLFQSDI